MKYTEKPHAFLWALWKSMFNDAHQRDSARIQRSFYDDAANHGGES